MDAELGLAFVWRRQGKVPMPAATWAHVMSLELSWMLPGEAKSFVARALDAGLLREDGGGLVLGFMPSSTELPRGFRLDPHTELASKAPSADPFIAWVDQLAASRGWERARALEAVSARQEENGGLLDAQAAVLQLAAEAGLDVKEAAAKALTAMFVPESG